MKTRFALKCGVAAFMPLAFISSAFAQEAATEDDSVGIRDIVVTAQRRAENIQNVPVAVTALDGEALDSAVIGDIRDIAGRVPSLVIDKVSAGPGAAAIALRGISFEDIEKSFDPAIGVSVDGVFIGTNTGQLLDPFDMERIEILRGPQGTLFGRNTIGGVISVTRTKPTEDAGLKAQFSYASYKTTQGRVVLNSGKLGGIFALKAFVAWDKTGGYVKNLALNRKDGRQETLSGGLTALIDPGNGLTATITYEHMRERGETIAIPTSNSLDLICAFAGVPGFSPVRECNLFNKNGSNAYVTYETSPRGFKNDTDAVTGNIDWEISPSLTLTSVTGYRSNKEDVRQDFDGSSAVFFATQRTQKFSQFSQELRLLANVSDRVNLLVGGYYFNSKYNNLQKTELGPVFSGGPASIFQDQYVDHRAKSYAGFADAQIELSDAFKISLGGRYTRDTKRIFNNYGRIIPLVKASVPTFTGVECVQVTGLLGPGVPRYGAANNCSGNESFGKFTWRANAQYTIDPGKMVYASFSRGFRSGGFNGRGSSPTSLGPYQPETVDAFEVGLKADWLDRKLRTNLAVYTTKYKNKQEEVVQPSVFAASGQETVVKNASSANIKGFELEAIAQLSRELSFNASLSYTDASYNRFFDDVVGLTNGSPVDGIGDDVSTMNLRRAPKFQWSAGLNYSREMGSGRLEATTLLRFQSKYATCIVADRPVVRGAVINDQRCFTESRENLSAQIGYTFSIGDGREVSVSVFGRNLTNNRGYMAMLPVAGLFTFASSIEPRVIGGQIGFKF